MTFLGENKHVNSQTTLICVTRLNCLKARLKKDEKLLQEYDSIFKAQLEAGIIELVPKDEEDFEGAHFLPHHGVLREDRETTKLRIVFYGSERADKNQYSLNDCLEKGPNLTPHVFEVLTKFRSYQNHKYQNCWLIRCMLMISRVEPVMMNLLFMFINGQRPS